MGTLRDGTGGRTAGFCVCFYFCFWNLYPFAPLSSPPESRTETRLCSAFLDAGKSACSVTHGSPSGWGRWGGGLPVTHRHTPTVTHTLANTHTLPPTSSCTPMYKTLACYKHTLRHMCPHSCTHTHTHALRQHTLTLVPPNFLLRCSKPALAEDIIQCTEHIHRTTPPHMSPHPSAAHTHTHLSSDARKHKHVPNYTF